MSFDQRMLCEAGLVPVSLEPEPGGRVGGVALHPHALLALGPMLSGLPVDTGGCGLAAPSSSWAGDVIVYTLPGKLDPGRARVLWGSPPVLRVPGGQVLAYGLAFNSPRLFLGASPWRAGAVFELGVPLGEARPAVIVDGVGPAGAGGLAGVVPLLGPLVFDQDRGLAVVRLLSGQVELRVKPGGGGVFLEVYAEIREEGKTRVTGPVKASGVLGDLLDHIVSTRLGPGFGEVRVDSLTRSPGDTLVLGLQVYSGGRVEEYSLAYAESGRPECPGGRPLIGGSLGGVGEWLLCTA